MGVSYRHFAEYHKPSKTSIVVYYLLTDPRKKSLVSNDSYCYYSLFKNDF